MIIRKLARKSVLIDEEAYMLDLLWQCYISRIFPGRHSNMHHQRERVKRQSKRYPATWRKAKTGLSSTCTLTGVLISFMLTNSYCHKYSARTLEIRYRVVFFVHFINRIERNHLCERRERDMRERERRGIYMTIEIDVNDPTNRRLGGNSSELLILVISQTTRHSVAMPRLLIRRADKNPL